MIMLRSDWTRKETVAYNFLLRVRKNIDISNSDGKKKNHRLAPAHVEIPNISM